MTVNTKITFQNFLIFHFKNFLLKPFPIIGFIVILVYIIKEFIDIFQNNFEIFSLLKALIFPLGFGFFIYKFYTGIKRAFYSNKTIQENNAYTFTTEKIQIQGETSEGELSWKSIYKVKELKDWFLIYKSAQTMIMISKAEMNGEQILELRKIITDNGTKAKLRKD